MVHRTRAGCFVESSWCVGPVPCALINPGGAQYLCRVLSALQQDAPAHSFRKTRLQVEAAFRRPLEAVFESFDEAPLASASIAQVCTQAATL